MGKLLEEINIINCSIDTIIKRASNDSGNIAAEEEQVKQGGQDGSILLAVVDSGTESDVMKPGNPCRKTGRMSLKKYRMATCHIMPGGEEALTDHEVREPVRTCDVPGITDDPMVSTSKFADTGYFTFLTARRRISTMQAAQNYCNKRSRAQRLMGENMRSVENPASKKCDKRGHGNSVGESTTYGALT